MEIERYSKLFSYRQQMINDTEFDVGLDCIRCGEKELVLTK